MLEIGKNFAPPLLLHRCTKCAGGPTHCVRSEILKAIAHILSFRLIANHSPKPEHLGLFYFGTNNRKYTMSKATENPPTNSQSSKPHQHDRPVIVHAPPSNLAQVLLPGSLDVSFALRYRR